MIWPAIIGGIASIAGGLLSNNSSRNAAQGMRYSPWNTTLTGLGGAQFANGQLALRPDQQTGDLNNLLSQMGLGQLDQFSQGQAGALGTDFLRGAYSDANNSQTNAFQNLLGASGLPSFNGMTPIQSGLPNPASVYGVNQGLPSSFFTDQGNVQGNANLAQQLGTSALQQGQGGYGGQNYLQAGQGMLGPYQQQNFGNLRGNMLSGFDPNQASSDYTNLLRAQAQPGEQQAASSALSKLFGGGRLGTTGGQNAYQSLIDSQNQADIGRQVAGQQHGLQQQLMAQQGLDSALNNEQGRQLGAFGANQQGMMNQYGIAQGLGSTGAGLMGSAMQNASMGLGAAQDADAFGFNRLMGLNDTGYGRGMNANMQDFDRQMMMNQTGFDRSFGMNQLDYNRQIGQNQLGFDRANSLYTASDTATQDRFARALQMFGGENAQNQQFLQNFQGLLGAGQSNNQQLMDLGRLGASVGQSQTAANSNAAMTRNQGNQDMIAGFLNAIGGWARDNEE